MSSLTVDVSDELKTNEEFLNDIADPISEENEKAPESAREDPVEDNEA